MGKPLLLSFMLMFPGNWVSSAVALNTASCPANCTCLSLPRHVLCANASLTSPPSQAANNTLELHLQHNNFSVLPNSFVADLPLLNGLYLSDCNIGTIQAGAFQELNTLRHLYLDRNQLDDLEENTFKNLSSLLYLHLEYNRLSYLHPGVFSSLNKLNALYLSHNLLTELSDSSLGGLAQLRWLDLGFNLLPNMSSQSLSGMNNLRRLNIEMNNLSSIPSTVRSLKGLQVLRLSGNRIRRLSIVSFGRRLRFLTELYLDSLGLEKLSSLAISRLKLLEVLDLRNNSLETLSLSAFKIFTKIYLAGNPWRCDCTLIMLRTSLKMRWIEAEQQKQARCQSPDALQGQSLVDVELQKLTCPPYEKDFILTTATHGAHEEGKAPQPSMYPIAATTTATAYITALARILVLSTPVENAVVEFLDPCLADHISDVLARPRGEESMEVSWSISGDYNQFEIRYNAGADQNVLLIIGVPTQVRLYNLHPGTAYTVCIVPQNKDIRKCQAPQSRQCAEGQTDGVPAQAHTVYSPPKPTSPFLIIGVSIAVVVLVVGAIFTVYTLRSGNLKFQRYYNEYGGEGSRRLAPDAYKLDGVYENIDEDRHVYVTASSLWGMDNEKLDCSLAEPVPFQAVPKYVTL
ncbi:hypothetical protein FKM82_021205 [Ascaphus truei]